MIKATTNDEFITTVELTGPIDVCISEAIIIADNVCKKVSEERGTSEKSLRIFMSSLIICGPDAYLNEV